MTGRVGAALGMFGRKVLGGRCLLAGAVILAAGPAMAQELRVGANDLLNLRVLGWNAVTGEVLEWPAVSGEYRVGADGMIVVPFAGPVEASGRLPAEIEEDIAAGLRDRLALTSLPDITLEFAAWSPVIVTGDVRSPGAVEFSPGMRAIQAMGLAGGADALAGEGGDRRRDAVTQQTSLLLLRDQERRFLARRARLVAELEGQDTIPVDPDAEQDDAWREVLASENLVLVIRRERLSRELAALDSQSELYTAEIAALERKTENLNGQRALAEQEAANASNLAERGLVGNQRVFDTARVLSDIEGQLLDVSTAMLRARQNLAATQRERVSLQDGFTAETLEALQETDARLAETQERIRGQRLLLQELGAGRIGEAEPEITVLRQEGGDLRRIEDAALEPLRPGDLVEVLQPIDEGNGAPLAVLDGAGVPDLAPLPEEPVATSELDLDLSATDISPEDGAGGTATLLAEDEPLPAPEPEAPAVAPAAEAGSAAAGSAAAPVMERPTVSPPARPSVTD